MTTRHIDQISHPGTFSDSKGFKNKITFDRINLFRLHSGKISWNLQILLENEEQQQVLKHDLRNEFVTFYNHCM